MHTHTHSLYIRISWWAPCSWRGRGFSTLLELLARGPMFKAITKSFIDELIEAV